MAEVDRFQAALDRVLAEARILRGAVPASLRQEADRLLEAQALLLADPALVDRTRGAILEGLPAERAWQEAVQDYLAIFSRIHDEDLRARAVQLGDVGRRVLAAMLGTFGPPPFVERKEAILVAETLGPTEALQLAMQPPMGLCLAKAAPMAPVAVVARRLDLPTVILLGEEFGTQLRPGDTLVVDGTTGLVEVRPDKETLAYYRERQQLLREARPAFNVMAPAHTADGWRVEVKADLEHPGNLLQALARGAEGVGLARTDFIYLGKKIPPGEDQQVEAYREILEQGSTDRVTFCTLSVGPEEALPFSAEPDMSNPLLGLRGARLSLAYLSAFREQLRAILRAGVGSAIGIAFPMIETLSEVRAALEWLRRAQQDLENARVPHGQDVTVALLLQTPLAVLNLPALVDEVDAFYLDLDRLAEYVMACDRHNLRVAHLFRPLHPVVLRLVGDAVAVAHRLGKRLDLCGESAGHPAVVALFLGLGVDGFCLQPERISPAKMVLPRLSVSEVQQLVRQALRLRTAAEVEALVEDFLQRRVPNASS